MKKLFIIPFITAFWLLISAPNVYAANGADFVDDKTSMTGSTDANLSFIESEKPSEPESQLPGPTEKPKNPIQDNQSSSSSKKIPQTGWINSDTLMYLGLLILGLMLILVMTRRRGLENEDF